jgi:hypothetical protein
MSDQQVTLSTACQRLQQADQAYHDLMRGAKVRSVQDENGESVAYTQADADKLLGYIRTLSVQCTAYVPTALGPTPYRSPMRFVF